MVHTSTSCSQSQQDALDSIRTQFTISEDTLLDIAKTFLREAAEGLASYGQSMAMMYVLIVVANQAHTNIPQPDVRKTGSTFLALDLGGTNLRVCEVTLHGDKTFSLRQQKYKVSEALKTGEVIALFDYLADSVDTFLTDSGSPSNAIPPSLAPNGSHDAFLRDNSDLSYIPLALTFSFPVEQTALDSGTLLTWTKGFSAKNAIGKDIVKLLQDAFDRKHIHVRCVALVNDTVGALLSRAYTSGGCILGAIFGTGTNGAYVEEVANITKLGNVPEAVEGGYMIVNTEWGAFNNTRSALPTTPYDNKLDRESINPRYQAFEKFISGMYLGEVARNVILSFIDASPKPLLFGGNSAPSLNKQWGLDTAVLSEIEEAWQGIGRFASGQPSIAGASDEEKLNHVRDVIVQRLGFTDPCQISLADADVVRQICGIVVTRAARLSSCAVAAILVQTGRARCAGSVEIAPLVDEGKRIGVGVDGSLVEFYPRFESMMRETLRALVGLEVEGRVDIGMAKDGSGAGAALCALVAHKQNMAKQAHGAYSHDSITGPPQLRSVENYAYLTSMS
ncbi:hexokinase [Boletus reticuloceps]|uniref:Phosphotransferase n=1 Tax=Boletus reticuloceps TaxID=495285 RepID=A0A8I2YQA3_9AGAM|nr:hexokinase [Boletus reticuloceps]